MCFFSVTELAPVRSGISTTGTGMDVPRRMLCFMHIMQFPPSNRVTVRPGGFHSATSSTTFSSVLKLSLTVGRDLANV
jgi:hypothetical protein